MRPELAIARRLAELAHAIESHLTAQHFALDQICEEVATSDVRGDVADVTSGPSLPWVWNEMDSSESWQCERDRVVELIEREREQLAAAWGRLEEEQRRLMMRVSPKAPEARTSNGAESRPLPIPEITKRPDANPERASDSTAEQIRQRLARQAAADRPVSDQFRQLRQEMDRQNRRS